MKWTPKDVMEAATTLTSPFENMNQENPLDVFRKAIASPVPKLPVLGNGEVKTQ